jgi:hypothetical protein
MALSRGVSLSMSCLLICLHEYTPSRADLFPAELIARESRPICPRPRDTTRNRGKPPETARKSVILAVILSVIRTVIGPGSQLRPCVIVIVIPAGQLDKRAPDPRE